MRTLFSLLFLSVTTLLAMGQDQTLPPLPVGVSSFGAVVCDGYIYTYGGHAGKTHSYDKASVLGSFQRLKLDGGKDWETLASGPIAQGLNLAAHNGQVIRVGGMQPKNDAGQPTDNHSVSDCAIYDPAKKTWSDLPALPQPRSSHDIAVVGDTLVVVGGWAMKGQGNGSTWHDTTLLLDLSAVKPEWKSIPQPFKRRALTTAVYNDQLYVLGGMSSEGAEPTVNILDVTKLTWSTGPDLPGSERIGFSPSAAVVANQLVVSTLDGKLHRLNEKGNAWNTLQMKTSRRMVARMLPIANNKAALIGGAASGGNATEIEIIELK